MSKLSKPAVEVNWKSANNCIFDTGSVYLQFSICSVMFCIYVYVVANVKSGLE